MMTRYRLLRLLSTLLLGVLPVIDALATPAPPWPVRAQLPDGTEITVKMTGDEHFMYVTTIDGYNVVESEDGYYYYAEDAGGRLVSTGVRANDPGRRSIQEQSILSRVAVGAPAWALSA